MFVYDNNIIENCVLFSVYQSIVIGTIVCKRLDKLVFTANETLNHFHLFKSSRKSN